MQLLTVALELGCKDRAGAALAMGGGDTVAERKAVDVGVTAFTDTLPLLLAQGRALKESIAPLDVGVERVVDATDALIVPLPQLELEPPTRGEEVAL